MSENETGQDTQDTAAALADEIFGEWKKYGRDWKVTLQHLGDESSKATSRYQMALRLQAVFAASGGQLPLIPGAVAETGPKKPRSARRMMMHSNEDGTRFECRVCDASAPIPEGETDGRVLRGIPCPKCNAAEEAT